MVAGTMLVYKAAIRIFLPMPSKSHYVFNLRDFARVVRGVLLVPASRMTEPDKLIRLWIHEVYRVFNDRLTDDTDRSVGCIAYDDDDDDDDDNSDETTTLYSVTLFFDCNSSVWRSIC